MLKFTPRSSGRRRATVPINFQPRGEEVALMLARWAAGGASDRVNLSKLSRAEVTTHVRGLLSDAGESAWTDTRWQETLTSAELANLMVQAFDTVDRCFPDAALDEEFIQARKEYTELRRRAEADDDECE